jgi:hypothetical protein
MSQVFDQKQTKGFPFINVTLNIPKYPPILFKVAITDSISELNYKLPPEYPRIFKILMNGNLLAIESTYRNHRIRNGDVLFGVPCVESTFQILSPETREDLFIKEIIKSSEFIETQLPQNETVTQQIIDGPSSDNLHDYPPENAEQTVFPPFIFTNQTIFDPFVQGEFQI